MKVTISGPPGSGTTTVAKVLAEKLNLPLISAGELFRKLARERGLTVEEFGRYADSNPEIDLLIDRTQKEEADKLSSCIVEGRLSGWMVNNATLKVFIFAPDEVRYSRIAKREKKSFEMAKDETTRRENVEKERYMKYYSIDFDRIDIYDLILNSASFKPEEIAELIIKALELKPEI
jgi:cytidylate kinase